MERILVAIDGSEASFRAVDFASHLADRTLAELEVVTVLDLGQLDVYDGFYLTTEQVTAWQERHKAHVLEQAGARAENALELPELTLLRGVVVPTLLQHARATGADLLVVGRTGKGALERVFQGSVSLALNRDATVPVVTVP